MPLVAVSTGLNRDSGDVHGRMRPKYLEEHAEWHKNSSKPPPMVRFMSKAYETAWLGKIALLKGDMISFGKLMNENHRIVNEMMAYCGFEDGAGWANNLLIEVALKNGALGSKLTGAGSGGSVFALTKPGEESLIAEVWREEITKAGLSSATVYLPHIVHHGLIIEHSKPS